MQKESDKKKNPFYDRQMICKLIYNESLTFHPEPDTQTNNVNESKSENKNPEITELPVKSTEEKEVKVEIVKESVEEPITPTLPAPDVVA